MSWSLCHSSEFAINGGWGSWSSFSSCSKTSREGTRTRTRQCNNPAPANGGAQCSGEASQTETCNTEVEECPCSLVVNREWMTSIKLNSTDEDIPITVWGSCSCTLRILLVGGGGGEYSRCVNWILRDFTMHCGRRWFSRRYQLYEHLFSHSRASTSPPTRRHKMVSSDSRQGSLFWLYKPDKVLLEAAPL